MVNQIQVQLRVPKETVKSIDSMIKGGRFSSRSEAIKAMIVAFQEKEKTREFYKMLAERSSEAAKGARLIPLSEI